MKTEVMYLNQPSLSTMRARVVDIVRLEGKSVVRVDRTPFYPQGGGQPSDTGWIEDMNGFKNRVKSVFVSERQTIDHVLETSRNPDVEIGQNVYLHIDMDVRNAHSRLHSAGEVICAAVHELGYVTWKMSSACHFPGQCRVVFDDDGEITDMPEFTVLLEDHVNKILRDDHEISSNMQEVAKI